MIAAFARDERGVAAVEFAVISVFMVTAIINTVDVGAYVFQAMEVENAAQMAAQTALQNCTIAQVPVTTNCPGFASRVATAITSTSLGNAVTLQTGSPTEGFYCVNASGALVEVGTLAAKPADCTAAGSATTTPGDFVVISVRYTYSPIMRGASIVAFLQTPIVRRAIMRVA